MPTTRRKRTYGRRPVLRFEALEPYEQAFIEDRMTRELSREGSFGAFCLEHGPMNSNPKHVRPGPNPSQRRDLWPRLRSCPGRWCNFGSPALD